MDANPMKKVKVLNSTAPSRLPIMTVDELNSGKKLIADLNHDCLAKVFMHLPVLERLEMEKICQKWKEAAEFSWYNVKKLKLDDLMITLDKKEETYKMIMIRCCRYLTHLTIIGNQYPWMCNILKNDCKNISHFSISMKVPVNQWKISNKDLVEIIGSMQKLKYLRLEMNGNRSYDLACKIVGKLPEDIQELHLLLGENSRIRSTHIPSVFLRFNGLRCLTLNRFSLTNEILQRILQNKNTLSKLDLSYSKFPPNALSIFSNLKNLENLNLFSVKNFNVNEIASIAHNCSKLKYFEFRNVIMTEEDGAIEDTLPFNIYRELKYLNLEHLRIDNYINKSGYEGENFISGIANNWKQLKYLNIKRGHRFSRADIEEISEFNNLECLVLWDVDEDEVDSESFINIANNCPQLKKLEMEMNIIPAIDLFELVNLKKLENLHFYDDNALTGELLSKIATNCKNLVDLNIESCNNVTRASLIQVGKLKHLKKLDIRGIKNVPNAIFNNLYNLKSLLCSYCPSITDKGILKVLDNCHKLSALHVKKTGITSKSLVHASKRKFVFEPLTIWATKSVRDDYKKKTRTPTPHLIIK